MTLAAGVGLQHEPTGSASRAGLAAAAAGTGGGAFAGDRDAVPLPPPSSAAVSRGGFLAALGSSAVATAAVLAAPKDASANGMLEFPPARLNNRYFLMRAGQGGSDKEGRVQSHPIDKLHMDNRLTEQGVEEVGMRMRVWPSVDTPRIELLWRLWVCPPLPQGILVCSQFRASRFERLPEITAAATAATTTAAAGATSRRRPRVPRCFRRLHLGRHLFSRPGHGQNLGPGARHPPGKSAAVWWVRYVN